MNIVELLLNVSLLGSAWVLWLLLVLSVLSFGVMFERVLFFRRNSRGGRNLRDDLLKALRVGDLDGAERLLRASGTIEGRVVAGAFAFRDGGGQAFGEAVEAELGAARRDLDRGMNLLGTLGSNAPFIGLFGTVIGVIIAFEELGTATTGGGGMGNVMNGIAEALVATGVGLFVAIPAVIAYNIAQKRVGDIEQDALSLGRLVSAWLDTQERGGRLRGEVSEAAPERVGRSERADEPVLRRVIATQGE